MASCEHALNTPAIIAKKRDGQNLSKREIEYFVNGVVNGDDVELAQLGAMLMAIKLLGMSVDEIVCLTAAMKNSGETLTWPDEWKKLVVDKHSTGGVGDKISLVLAPALAACGLKVPMISGRGLGFTGGTLDKLEAVPGFNVSLSIDGITKILETVGCCIVGQTQEIDPADRIMYAIRDVTATIDSIPLITASIVSKKAAENIAALVLDVKYGQAAFMKTIDDAKELAKSMVDVSNGLGIKTEAVISSMDTPVGRTIGNGLEVKEAVGCLMGKGPDDLVELVTTEGGMLLYASGKAVTIQEGKSLIQETLNNGSALKKFELMLIGQGVKQSMAKRLCEKDGDIYRVLRRAANTTETKIKKSGYIKFIDALIVAHISSELGAGRKKAGDPVNHAVGIELLKVVGDEVKEGDIWAYIHHDDDILNGYTERLNKGITICDEPVDKKNRVCAIVR